MGKSPLKLLNSSSKSLFFSLILNLHHTDKNSQKIRFLNGCFDKRGQILALADKEGSIFIIDFSTTKFWNIPKFTNTCVIVKFSTFKESEILVGAHSGVVYVVDVQTGYVCGQLIGHENPVNCVSYGNNFLCLTGSASEAILWDLNTNTKLQVLNLQHSCSLKYVRTQVVGVVLQYLRFGELISSFFSTKQVSKVP